MCCARGARVSSAAGGGGGGRSGGHLDDAAEELSEEVEAEHDEHGEERGQRARCLARRHRPAPRVCAAHDQLVLAHRCEHPCGAEARQHRVVPHQRPVNPVPVPPPVPAPLRVARRVVSRHRRLARRQPILQPLHVRRLPAPPRPPPALTAPPSRSPGPGAVTLWWQGAARRGGGRYRHLHEPPLPELHTRLRACPLRPARAHHACAGAVGAWGGRRRAGAGGGARGLRPCWRRKSSSAERVRFIGPASPPPAPPPPRARSSYVSGGTCS